MRSPLPALLCFLIACEAQPLPAQDDTLAIGALVPAVREAAQVVPGPGLPQGVEPQDANNNLDITWHDGRLFLAFRSAPDHFASDQAELFVVSTVDEQTWRAEGQFAFQTDVREPQLVSWNGELHLWFALLGTDPAAFEPQGSRHTVWRGPDSWDPVESAFPDDFIPWRIKPVQGRLNVVGYTGGAGVYDPAQGEPIRIRWLASDDGESWEPAVPDHEVVHEGGASESDFTLLDDGTLVAVLRNEGGDEGGFGAKICLAAPSRLGTWQCSYDPRKYDSPLVFQRADRVWMIGRRTLTEDGLFDLGRRDLGLAEQYLLYQITWWQAPKRCSLWEIDPTTRTVHWILDLPSRGDTCFPEAVELGEDLLVYNYSSDPDGADLPWFEGQKAPTGIWRQILDFTP